MSRIRKAQYQTWRGEKIRTDKLKSGIVESHEYVTAIVNNRKELVKAMEKYKATEDKLTSRYIKKVKENNNLEEWNGFATDYNYFDDQRVSLKSQELVAYDTNVSAGIQRIREWALSLQKNLNKKILKMLDMLLTVRSSGFIPRNQLTKLCSMGYEDEQYLEAVKQIQSNMRIIGRKTYVNVEILEPSKIQTSEGEGIEKEWKRLSVSYGACNLDQKEELEEELED